MEYISVKQAAGKWDTSVQIVRRFCRQERINGAIQSNGSWLIPANARKPKRIEGIDPDVEKLPLLARTLIRQKKKKNFHGLYDYVQTDFTYSSCRMASNRLTRGQVETIFKKGKVSVSFEPMKISDLIEVLNHCVCVDYILDHIEEPLSTKFIKNLHYQLTFGTVDERKKKVTPGQFRTKSSQRKETFMKRWRKPILPCFWNTAILKGRHRSVLSGTIWKDCWFMAGSAQVAAARIS